MKKANTAAYAEAVGRATGKKKKKKYKHSKAHPGFNTVADQIAQKQGVSKERAAAMLAASTRSASASAKRKNPRLKRV